MFVFLSCQVETEPLIKRWLARDVPDLRFAFSRPGLLTYKLERLSARVIQALSQMPLIRTWGESWTTVQGELEDVARWLGENGLEVEPGHLHVWERDKGRVGERGFEPFVGAEPMGWGERLRGATGRLAGVAVNEVAQAGDVVLDVMLVDPQRWLVGWHQAGGPPSRWPGGVPPFKPTEVVSRAYYKLNEALMWSELPVAGGQTAVELGSAPGGACQALLERGLNVIGIDPAEMDPRVAEHERFEHLRMRAAEVRKVRLRRANWLVCDTNVAPKHTLDAAGSIALNQHVHLDGMVLTLKMPSWTLLDSLEESLQRLREEGWTDVRARHLAFNRQELCVVARRFQSRG